ncbi:hypothetical protein LF817_04705 [Halobacillus sp. A1]|uniref:hypothetical protein n=1 Tax=Halobacillus sp. A1 TaxID=2880262 RepID=UPI0020A6D6CD|nr:hypothetical protein [Halobacillus sp. A1]MCP3030634.1 hypothetical protein [Halobacillus sp. A1]
MISFSILDSIFQWFDNDLLQIFGIEAWHVLFGLVFLLVMSSMWVIKPVLEWGISRNWITFMSYVCSLLVVFLFLQLVDRYAIDVDGSLLPSYFWSISLLAMSAFGTLLVLGRSLSKLAKKFMKKSKKAA